MHVFYGEVKLSVQEKTGKNANEQEYTYYILKIRIKNKEGEWKERTSIYRGNVKDNIDESKIYQIAMIGNLNFGSEWWRIDLIGNMAIRYREIGNVN